MIKLQKFFLNDKVFKAMTAFALLGFVVSTVLEIDKVFNPLSVAMTAFIVLGVMTIYVAYRNKENSVAKSMIGAVIGFQMCVHINYLFSTRFAAGAFTAGEKVLGVAAFLVTALLFINHFRIISEHASDLKRVIFSQYLWILKIVLLVDYIPDIVRSADAVGVAVLVFNALAHLFTFGLIVCIETRLDSYRYYRETAEAKGEWTEELKAETKEKVFGEKE